MTRRKKKGTIGVDTDTLCRAIRRLSEQASIYSEIKSVVISHRTSLILDDFRHLVLSVQVQGRLTAAVPD